MVEITEEQQLADNVFAHLKSLRWNLDPGDREERVVIDVLNYLASRQFLIKRVP